jgi:hypothetical protein
MVRKATTIVIFLLVLAAVVPSDLFAYVMGSSNYRLGSDSVNFGGSENSGSGSYKVSDTLGEVGTGFSSSTSYSMNAGYRQMQSTYISMSLVQSGFVSSVNGLFGGQSEATTSVNVITDNPAGYALYVKANTSPALQGSLGAFFSDYTPSGGVPDLSFTLPSTESRLGFTPEGVDIVQDFKDNSSLCGVGGLDTANACWDGLSTTDKMIAQGATSNQPSGATTTVKYRAAVGSNKIQDSGSYSSTVIYTAVTL